MRQMRLANALRRFLVGIADISVLSKLFCFSAGGTRCRGSTRLLRRAHSRFAYRCEPYIKVGLLPRPAPFRIIHQKKRSVLLSEVFNQHQITNERIDLIEYSVPAIGRNAEAYLWVKFDVGNFFSSARGKAEKLQRVSL